jgi:hypothetical protein
MGVNWDSGVLFWKDHAPRAAERYSLSHLHPFRQRLELPAVDKRTASVVELYVCFGLHTFTRAIESGDRHPQFYRDNRETRTFCPSRYRRSFELPTIIRTLETHPAGAGYTSTRSSVMCSAEQPRSGLPNASDRGFKNAKPRFGRGFVIPDPLTCHRGGTSREAGMHQAGFCAPGQSLPPSLCISKTALSALFRASDSLPSRISP